MVLISFVFEPALDRIENLRISVSKLLRLFILREKGIAFCSVPRGSRVINVQPMTPGPVAAQGIHEYSLTSNQKFS